MITLSASLQRQQLGYAVELARWTGRYINSGGGIQSGTVASGIGRPGEVPMRAFARAGLAQSPHSFEHEDASVLMVLASRSDDRLGALRAGEATSAVLLATTDPGLATTPLSQPATGSGPDQGIDRRPHRRPTAVPPTRAPRRLGAARRPGPAAHA